MRRRRGYRRIDAETLEDRLAMALLVVNTNADNTISDTDLTLREAIALVNSQGNEITALGRALTAGETAQVLTEENPFGNGDAISVPLANQTLTLTSGRLHIYRPVEITGVGANTLSIDAANASQHFFIDGRSNGSIRVVLSQFSLINGNANGGGSITGGIDNGIRGGSLFNDSAEVIVRQVNMQANQATNSGGAIYNLSGILEISNSTLQSNFAATFGGGGIYNAGTLTISNSTISGNVSRFNGGGIRNGSGTLMIANSTLTNNRADSDGDGTGTGGGVATNNSGFAITTLTNTIVAGNFVRTGATANDLAERAVEAGSSNNLIGDVATAGGLTNNANGNKVGFVVGIVLDTTLANIGGPMVTHALIAGSPAINAGLDANIPSGVTTDQRGSGYLRLVGTVDIGAVEWYQDSDLNRTGAVDITDVLISVFYFNTYANQLPLALANLPAGPPFVDASGDGFFDIKDLLRVVFDYNVALGNPEGEFALPPLSSLRSPAPALSLPPATDAVFTDDIDWLWPELLTTKRRKT